ncbi:heme ABC transporter ATP-binding protein [Actinomadura sp. CNU-125]|uniref:heme ABC transporter ATP-binding protein n=1 Tax=Actinomadura sp. CNU-125 TaxID=1904961 RepID=UPI0009F99E48|nr:heme ABC transporter ATP-binding protein [Actinomadura sp. CNU-125]
MDGVDLELRHGETLVLVGPNGAGKSTLLAAVPGDTAPASGRVVLHGRPLDAHTAREQAMRRAVLPQRHSLAFGFTVEEVVRMGRAPWAGTPAEDDDDTAVADALHAADIAAFADRPFTSLSGGEQARAALARVLAQCAATVLLDEPTAALDIGHQEHVLALLRAEAANGHAVLAVVHDLTLAAAHADRVAVLSGGRVAACGPPGRVLTADLLGDVYRHPIEVLPHPRTSRPLILPERPAAPPEESQ